MIVGTADLEELGRNKPTVEDLPEDSLSLRDVDVFQAFYEMPQRAREALLPPGLHPTNPAGLVFQVWKCEDSPFGGFALAQTRIQCRSGMRPRGLVTGAVCDNAKATSGLRSRLGFPVEQGEVKLSRAYDRVTVDVSAGGRPILALVGEDPDPLDGGDLQFSSTLTLAHLDRGMRLIQIEPTLVLERAERVQPELSLFEASAWGDPRLEPYYPVSASVARGQIEIPPVRFVCRPGELAFTGTESARD